ncbi:MAG: hypothetical protein QNJ65_21720 [Xenococcaceae cyanobacterium MO_234.B1]|nr:hypothetical protein [Xenococcaceae cyanobacterium MO_234.B1]
MNKKKMGAMTSLSKLSGIKSKPDHTTEVVTPKPEVNKSEVTEDKKENTKAKVSKKKAQKKTREKLVTVNIKIREDQKKWLADTASQVRNNNSSPVPPAERVYPQHLIGVAIDLLKNADVDWGEVKNIEELRKHINL